ncbi:unnamed protein product [Closterium sp. Yama58-4]|nr:unnamed protein product [Closterium sp. Yama58-4]
MGNTMVNYSTFLDDNKIHLPYAPSAAPLPLHATRASLPLHPSHRPQQLPHSPLGHPSSPTPALHKRRSVPSHCPSLHSHPRPFSRPSLRPFSPLPPPSFSHLTSVYPYYVNLKLGSQKQQFSMLLDLQLRHTFVPCDCLHCGSARKGTVNSKPFSTLTSTTLKYISCVDQRCQGGLKSGYYGCNTQGLPNYLNVTDLPGDDALCVYDVYAATYDYYEADTVADSYLESAGHVVEDTIYLTAPDGTEVNRSIILGPFLEQLSAGSDSFAVCLEEPTPTNKTGWDGKVPLQTGSSHLTIGATGLPAGANYSRM